MYKILVIDDDPDHAESTAEGLRSSGFDCKVSTSGQQAIKFIDEDEFDVVLVDLVMQPVNGIEVLRKVRSKRPESEVIIITGYPSYETCVEALNEGAYDYVDKPINFPILRAKIKKALERQRLIKETIQLKKELNKKYGFEGIIGNSDGMLKVFETLRLVSATDTTVLITGESGTGKELVARALRNNSLRKSGHFVPINCASLPETLLESELFGHEKGAFTGALYTRKGRFEYADGGTLFLDEIGDMPLHLQAKFLRAIEFGEFTRIGSNEPIKVNVRIITATNKDLSELIKQGKFREDLYFRINVVRIDLPPLRRRFEDVPPLVKAFISEFSQLHKKKIDGISQEAMKAFYRYGWPGNVRELRNCIESMIVLTTNQILDVKDIPSYIKIDESSEEKPSDGALCHGATGAHINSIINLDETEKTLIKQALALTDGNREKAAKMLGIGERTLYRKIKQYGL